MPNRAQDRRRQPAPMPTPSASGAGLARGVPGRARRLPGGLDAAERVRCLRSGLDAYQARDALRLTAGPTRAAADVAAGAARRAASQPGPVISQRNAAVGMLDAVDPLDRAARQGNILARDQGHISSVTQSGHRCGRLAAIQRRRRLASSPARRGAGRERRPIRPGCRRSSPGSSHRRLASLGHPWLANLIQVACISAARSAGGCVPIAICASAEARLSNTKGISTACAAPRSWTGLRQANS